MLNYFSLFKLQSNGSLFYLAFRVGVFRDCSEQIILGPMFPLCLGESFLLESHLKISLNKLVLSFSDLVFPVNIQPQRPWRKFVDKSSNGSIWGVV